MKRITKRGKHVLDVLHYWTSLGWLGVGFCQLTLNVIALVTDDPVLRHAAHEITHLFDRALLIALGLGSLATGVLLGLKTKWGLTRYVWVFAKLVLSVAMLVFTPVWMGGWIAEAVDLSGNPADPAYTTVRTELFTGSVSIVSTLLLITVLSVVKPWGRTRSGARSRPAAAAPPASMPR